MPKLHIILTCDGGNGHKAAAEALQMRAMAAEDTVDIINTSRTGWFSNMFFDLGALSTKHWDWAQRNSHTELLRIFASMRNLSGLLFSTSFKTKSYSLLQNRDDINTYSEVIFHNTQPNNLQHLLSSVARYNRECKTHNQSNPEAPRNLVKFINHFTDLPTSQAMMFKEEMSRIDVADLNDSQFELHARPPILNTVNDSSHPEHLEFRYHQKIKQLYPKLYLDLPSNTNRVKFVDGPIREAFISRKNNPALKENGLDITFSNEAEFNEIKQILADQFNEFNIDHSSATLSLKNNAQVVSLMLGSQASIDGTLSLVQKELESPADSSDVKYLFVFCGANKPAEGLRLYSQVLDIAKKVNTAPDSRIKIVPLTNQPAKMIADVYSLADRVITRPGGISVMEIEAVVKGQIFLFTELGKVQKLFHWMTFRSTKSLEEQYCKQHSTNRFNDLIAWEHGNGLHAQSICKDSQGRTRVIPVNIYTFHNELRFSHKKSHLLKLIENQEYYEAFDALSASPELTEFMLTGHGAATDLSHLTEIIRLCDKAYQELSELTLQHKQLNTLDNGPIESLELISKLRWTIRSTLQKKTTPSDILTAALDELDRLQYILKNNVDAVKRSPIENKHAIIKTLEFIYRAIVNFFRSIFGFKPIYTPSAVLEHVRHDVTKTMNPSGIKNEWSAIDEIIADIIQENPEQKNRTFKIKKEKYPDLNHDFIYCGASTANIYLIGKELRRNDTGVQSFLQNRNGEPVLVTEHLTATTRINHSKELDCLTKMNLLIDHGRYISNETNDSSDYISLQQYIPGKTLNDYVRQTKTSLFEEIKAFPRERKIKLALALALGLKEIADKGITHGDINPQKILIQEKANQDLSATFIGFELSQTENNPQLDKKPALSQDFSAPELLSAQQEHEDGTSHDYPYSEKSDIYSLGMILKGLNMSAAVTERLMQNNPQERASLTEVIALLSNQLSDLNDTHELSRAFQM